jgi:hypothetical protein
VDRSTPGQCCACAVDFSVPVWWWLLAIPNRDKLPKTPCRYHARPAATVPGSGARCACTWSFIDFWTPFCSLHAALASLFQASTLSPFSLWGQVCQLSVVWCLTEKTERGFYMKRDEEEWRGGGSIILVAHNTCLMKRRSDGIDCSIISFFHKRK